MKIPQLMITAAGGNSVVVVAPEFADMLAADLSEAGLKMIFEDPKYKTIGFKSNSSGNIERVSSETFEETDERVIWLEDPQHDVFGIANKWIKSQINA